MEQYRRREDRTFKFKRGIVELLQLLGAVENELPGQFDFSKIASQYCRDLRGNIACLQCRTRQVVCDNSFPCSQCIDRRKNGKQLNFCTLFFPDEGVSLTYKPAQFYRNKETGSIRALVPSYQYGYQPTMTNIHGGLRKGLPSIVICRQCESDSHWNAAHGPVGNLKELVMTFCESCRERISLRDDDKYSSMSVRKVLSIPEDEWRKDRPSAKRPARHDEVGGIKETEEADDTGKAERSKETKNPKGDTCIIC